MFMSKGPSIATLATCLCLAFVFSVAAPVMTTAQPQGCCVGLRGNVSGDVGNLVDLSDLSALISYLTGGGYILPCPAEANLSGDPQNFVDLSDLSALISYLTGGGFALTTCTMDFATRDAAFNALDSFVAALGDVSRDSLARGLLNFFNSRSEFEAAGIRNDITVWARFTDGRILIIPNNRLPDTSAALDHSGSIAGVQRQIPNDENFVLPERRFRSWKEIEQAAAAVSAYPDTNFELPHSVTAFLGNALSGFCFRSIMVYMKGMLEENGYLVTVGSTVDDMLGVQDYGFFYIEAHGGTGENRDGTEIPAIWTRTDRNYQNEVKYHTMLDSNELVYMKGWDHDGYMCRDGIERLGFTGAFVAQYMSFTPNSFVYVSACQSDEATLKTGFSAAGASVYASWSYDTEPVPSNRAGLFVVERMLGISEPMLPDYAAPEESPKQRPFGIFQLWQDMKDRNPRLDSGMLVDVIRGINRQTPTYFNVTKLRDNFELLAPSIRYLQVLPRTDTVEMTGYFGSDPGSKGHVLVNGIEQPVYSWSPWLIRFHIPPTGPGSAGPVTVELEPISGPSAPMRRISNPVNLTDWKGTFTFSEENAGTLKKQISMTVHIRADVHNFREVPHLPDPDMNPYIVFGRVEGDTGRVTAAGQWIDPIEGSDPYEEYIYDRSGTKQIGLLNEPDPAEGFLYQGFVRHSGSNKWIDLNLNGMAYTGIFETVTSSLYGLMDSYELSVTPMQEVYDPLVPPYFLNYFTLTLPINSGTYTIAAGQNDATVCCSYDPDNPDVQVRMEWNNITPTFAPDTTAAQ